MKKIFPIFIISSLFLLSSSCGKKGAIYPPIIRIPQRVKKFRAIQRADKIILEWTNPTTYIDGNPMREIDEIEIWLAEEKRESAEKEESDEEEKLSVEEFEKKAELLASIKREKFSEYLIEQRKMYQNLRYIFPLSGKEFLTKKFIFGLRVKDRKRNKSRFSGLESVEPKILPLPPKGLRFTVYKDRIQILWDPPEKNMDQSSPPNVEGYIIFRADRETQPRRINPELIKENKYEDEGFVFDKAYKYFVRASATDSRPFLQSENSETLEVLAKDKFAPEAPSGLVSMTGKNYIALSWDDNQEEDLAGYRVWRKEEGEEEYLLLTTEPVRENTYTDTKVEKNKRYYYSITALDKHGNESKKSEAASEIIKDTFS